MTYSRYNKTGKACDLHGGEIEIRMVGWEIGPNRQIWIEDMEDGRILAITDSKFMDSIEIKIKRERIKKQQRREL